MSSYNLDPQHVAELYHQEYLRTAKKGNKFNSLDGALQRAVIEEALIETEAMKLSKAYGEDASKNEVAYFEKYSEFYAYQAAQNPNKFREKDSNFLKINFMKKDRDSARMSAIIKRAHQIDNFKSGIRTSQIKTVGIQK